MMGVVEGVSALDLRIGTSFLSRLAISFPVDGGNRRRSGFGQ